MAASTPDHVADDFKDVLAHLISTGIVRSDAPQAMKLVAQRVHALVYTLVIWRFRLGTVPSYARPFLAEIASDALLLLPQILLGYSRTTKLLLRGIIENSLKYSFYIDHPVEFFNLNSDHRDYVSIKELFDYLKSHPNLAKAEKGFDAIARMQTLYSTLSAGVHGQTVADLKLHAAFGNITFQHDAALVDLQLLKRCAECCNFVLAVQSGERLGDIPRFDMHLILKTMHKKARSTLNELERIYDRTV